MSADQKISEIKFVKSVDYLPSRKMDMKDLDRIADTNSCSANVVTAPENPMGYPGIDPIVATCMIAKMEGMIAMPHITPRDKDKLHIYTEDKLGIRNSFVEVEEPIRPEFESREVRELDVMELTRAVKGPSHFIENKGADNAVGSAFSPYRKNESEIARKKKESCADFYITQMIYVHSNLPIEYMKKRSYKISAGFIPVTRKSQIHSIRKIDVRLDLKTLARPENSTIVASESTRVILDSFNTISHVVDEIHILPMGNNKLEKEILESI